VASGIGETLRAARRQQSISLTDAAAATRVRETYLAALEEEEFAALGGDVYVKGFLRSYSRYLGVDPEPLLAAYRREHERPEELPPLTRGNARLAERERPPAGALLLVAVVVAVALFALFRFLGGDDPAAVPAPSPAEQLVRVPGPTLTVVATGTGAPVRVVLFADGVVAFDGLLGADESASAQGTARVAVRADDAGAVELTVNGEPYGTAGVSGVADEVVFAVEAGTPGEAP
jgi:cytoskeleton protein RodZ